MRQTCPSNPTETGAGQGKLRPKALPTHDDGNLGWAIISKEPDVVIACHGHFDLASYDKYLKGELSNFAMPSAEIDAALRNLPKFGN